MKKLIFAFLLISSLGFSQEKSIEVLVKDTIMLKPLSFEYAISGDTDFDFGQDNNKKRTETIKQSNKKVLEFLESTGLRFEENQFNVVYAALAGNVPKSYMVFVPSLEEKQEFLQNLELTEGIEYNLARTNYEQNESTEERIYKKLLEKADKRAELLERTKSLKIVDLIEISETKASETVFSSFMEKLLSRGDAVLDVTTTFISDEGVLRKSISVKYRVE
ncbi:hypothetical protein [Flagellimonas sp. 2504JD4-2]